MRAPRVLTVLLCAALAGPVAGAAAAPPPNDGPEGAAPFEPVTAADGNPRDLQAIADLAEATPDAGVPRCLGPGSFQRTAWFRVAAAEVPQQITVEAAGETLAVADLAAFVQPEGVLSPLRRMPNVCDGLGAGGSDAAEEPTSGVALQVPARRSVLIQAGLRGATGSPQTDRLVLSLDTRALPVSPPPFGDVANARTPRASVRRSTLVDLADASITEDDPADPSCPALGSVWRRLVPSKSGPRLITVRGRFATTLSVYSGRGPTLDRELDCVNRTSTGTMQMNVRARRGRPLWIRLGADAAPSGARGKIRIEDGTDRPVVDGGPGGFDPTTGGPAGGLPSSCERSRPERARVRGPRIGGTTAGANRRAVVPVRIAVRGSALCDALVELVGKRGRVFATGVAVRLAGRSVVRLRRGRHFVRGGYRLRVHAVDQLGRQVSVRSGVRGKLR